MKNALIFATSWILFVCLVCYVDFRLTGGNALLSYNEYGQLVFDFRGYADQFSLIWNNFLNSVSDGIADMPLDFSSVLNAIKSVVNMIIYLINLILVPFNFLGMILESLVAVVGLSRSENFFVSFLRGLVAMSIPYLQM